ncbi:MAG: hypothetical protein WAJ96_19575 [Candidatus Acidiferrum sp.]
MKMFYGNYDPGKNASVTSIPRDKTSLPGPGDVQMTVKTLFSSLSGNPGQREFVLLTYAAPSREGYDCHACAPVIGMAVFSEEGSKWSMDASNRSVCISGAFGNPSKNIEIVQIGRRQLAAKIIDVGGGQGETTAVLQLLVPWRGTLNLALQRVIGDDDQGGCGEDAGGLPCYANHRSVTFRKKETAEHYDLELELSGTDMPLSRGNPSTGARQVGGTEIYTFQDGKYVRTSMQGDTTFLDDFVAKQKEALRAGRAPD